MIAEAATAEGIIDDLRRKLAERDDKIVGFEGLAADFGSQISQYHKMVLKFEADMEARDETIRKLRARKTRLARAIESAGRALADVDREETETACGHPGAALKMAFYGGDPAELLGEATSNR
jgi:chromosome segregation ATPase